MDATRHADPTTLHAASRLVVADWTVDPEAVVTWCRAHDEGQPCALSIVVPAWLHGLDWVGDPLASVPCAQRQLDAVLGLAAAGGLTVCGAAVGDPDPATAIADALERSPATGVMLCTPVRRLAAGPLDLARRARRLTGLPVQQVAVPSAPNPARWSWPQRRRGHCALEVARAA